MGRDERTERTHDAPRIAATLTAALVVAAAVVSAMPAAAQEYTELSRDEEIRLAMSAGPPTLSRDADVWVMGPEGFEKVVEGSNGFACMVIRSAADPTLLAPHCFSPDAVASVVPAKLAEARLQRQGLTQARIDARLEAAFQDGSLPLPSGQAHAYMLSSGQRLGAAGRWMPHFMIYMPYATNEDVAGDPANPLLPFVGPETGHAHSTLVVVMREFVDPRDVQPPR